MTSKMLKNLKPETLATIISDISKTGVKSSDRSKEEKEFARLVYNTLIEKVGQEQASFLLKIY